MTSSSTNADSILNDGDERKGEDNVEGKLSYPLYCDRTAQALIKMSSWDHASIERCRCRPKIHAIVVCSDQSSLSMV